MQSFVRYCMLATLGTGLCLVAIAGSAEAAQNENGIGGAVDRFYGSYGESHPILVPPYHGIEPRLSLSYNSSGPNGFAGVGFQLAGFGVIERASPGKGAPSYGPSDIFLFEGHELAPCAAGSVSPSCTTGGTHSTKIESYRRIKFDGAANTWTIWEKDGTLTGYAPTHVSAQGTFRWGIARVVDTLGNEVDYTWAPDGQEVYPAGVRYNGTQIKLYWETRPDRISYAAGISNFVFITGKRLKTIDVTVGGVRARSYTLAYSTSSDTGRSQLTSITQYGKDAILDANGMVTGGTALPPARFTYTTGGSSLDIEGWSTRQGGMGNGTVTGDFNGDGKTDFAHYWYDSGAWDADVHLSTGGSFAPPAVWAYQQGGWISTGTWVTGDFNGDGMTDFAQIWPGSGWPSTANFNVDVHLSTGTSFVAQRWATDLGRYYEAGNWVTGDFNGDGMTDFAQYWSDGGQWSANVYLSTGSAFVLQSWAVQQGGLPGTWVTGDFNGDGKTDFAQYWNDSGLFSVDVHTSTGTGFSWARWATQQGGYIGDWKTGDFNGDGKTDFVQYWNGGSSMSADVHLSSGQNFGPWGRWATQQGAYFTAGTPATWVTGDFNGDGKTDLAQFWSDSGYFSLDVHIATPVGFVVQRWATQLGSYFGADWFASWWTGDFNGDGKTDFAQTWAETGALLWTADVHLSQGGTADLLNSSVNGVGGTRAVAYLPSSTWTNTNNPPLVPTVATLTTSDGRGNSSTDAFAYNGGLMDRLDRRFLGFRYAAKTLPCIAGESACPYEQIWFKQDYGSLSKPEYIHRADGQNRLQTQDIFVYATNGATVPYTSLETDAWSVTYDGSGQACTAWPCPYAKRTRTTYSYDAYGNVVTQAQYRDFDVSGDELVQYFAYMPNTTSFIVNRVAGETRTDLTNVLYGSTLTVYDGNPWNQPPTRGVPTQTVRVLEDSANVDPFYVATATMVYDASGNLTSVTDALGATTTYAFDSAYHVFPVSQTNALGQTTSSTWDPVCGVPVQLSDRNAQTTSIQYDGFCRQTRSDGPLGAFEVRSYVATGDPNAQYVHIEGPSADGSGNVSKSEYFDGLGRTYGVTSRGPVQGQYIVSQWVTFDARGNVKSSALPFYTGAPVYWTTSNYDCINRLTRQTKADGTSTATSYGLWSKTTTDADGHQVTEISDALGIRSKVEYHLGQAITTTYSHDAEGRLVGIRDAMGNVWSWTFDTLDRRTSLSDPDFGVQSDVYDAAGHVVSHTDAKQQDTTWSYDPLGRPTQRRSSLLGSQQPLVLATTAYTYDESRKGYFNVGHMTTLSDAWGGRFADYDAAGRLAAETRSIDGTAYSRQMQYDAAGRLLGVTYPDGDAIGTPSAPLLYDAAGRLRAIPTFVTNATYDASGRLLVETNANGTTTTRTYSPQRGFLTGISTVSNPVSPMGGASRALLSLSYARDPLGLTTQVASAGPGESWNYAYDDLNRLTEAQNTTDASSTEAFNYDVLGNVTSSTRMGTFQYPAAGSPRPHAVIHAGTSDYSYDKNGNLTAGAGRTIQWNADNAPVNISGVTFEYEGGGTSRLKKVSTAGVVTVYPFGDDYQVRDGEVTKYVKLGGQLVAKRVGGANYWLHTDHQGSVRSITDATGLEVQRQTYQPFGERRSTSTSFSETRGWNGERQDGTGLFYLHARYYDPDLGRFISPDPSHPLAPGVGLNRYTYAFNNPVSSSDDSGLECESEGSGDCGSSGGGASGDANAAAQVSASGDSGNPGDNGNPGSDNSELGPKVAPPPEPLSQYVGDPPPNPAAIDGPPTKVEIEVTTTIVLPPDGDNPSRTITEYSDTVQDISGYPTRDLGPIGSFKMMFNLMQEGPVISAYHPHGDRYDSRMSAGNPNPRDNELPDGALEHGGEVEPWKGETDPKEQSWLEQFEAFVAAD